MTRGLLIGAGALFVIGGALAWYWTRTHQRLDKAQAQVEALTLQLKGQIVMTQETRRELGKSVDDLLRENQELRHAYDEARALAPGSKPIASGSLQTERVKVEAPARAPPVAPEGSVAPAPQADTGRCVLAQDDAISFLVEELALETGQGNRLVVGTAEAWREDPPPRALLGRGRFQAALSDTASLAPAPAPRWGVLALGACTSSGCGPGLGLLAPPLRAPLLGWRLEPQAQVLALPGAWVGALGLGVRF